MILQDDPEIPAVGSVAREVGTALCALETVFAEKENPLPSYTIDVIPPESTIKAQFSVEVSVDVGELHREIIEEFIKSCR